MEHNIGQLLAKRAARNPSVEAMFDVAADRRLSYRELDQRANRVANALAGAGVATGDRVALLLMNGHQFVETFYGTAKIGGVLVALNWRLVADELAFILTDAGAETLVFGTEFNELVADLHARGADGTSVTRWIHVGDAADRPEFASGYEDAVAAASDVSPEITAGDDDLLFLMYTSGTTGLPKGVMHTHRTTLWAMITANATADIRVGDRYLLCLPLFHVGALNPLMTGIYLGSSLVVMREFDPTAFWNLLGQERITNSLAVPAMLQFMLLTYDRDQHDISHLRWIMSGASPVPVTLIEQYVELGVEIHQVYGLTESGGPACLISPDDAIARAGSTGQGFLHTEVKVVGDDGEPVAADEPGEVWVRGEHIMAGYWNRPEATAETITPDGWLRTGDIAIVDADGFVYIHDRVKDMIISGGENVYPAEIENVLLAHPSITECAVIGIPSAKWGESPMAIVVRSDDALTEREVLDWCDGKLARFKLPVRAEFTDVIPRNPTGKVLKRVLRDQYVTDG